MLCCYCCRGGFGGGGGGGGSGFGFGFVGGGVLVGGTGGGGGDREGSLRGCRRAYGGIPHVDNGRLQGRVDLALDVAQPGVGLGSDVDVEGVGALQARELGVQMAFQAVGDLFGRLRGHNADRYGRFGRSADGHGGFGLGDFDPMHRQVGISPSLHQRQRKCLFVLDLRVAREEGRGDGRVGLGLALGQFIHRVVEVWNRDLGPGGSDQCGQKDRQILQRLVLHGFPVDAAVEIGLVGVDGDGRVNHTAHPEREAGDMVVEPIAVGQQDEIDRSNGVVGRLDGLTKPSRAGFFFTFEEECDIAR